MELFNQIIIAVPLLFTEPFYENYIFDEDFTLEELQNIMSKAKNNKAPGPDRVTYMLLINSPIQFLKGIFQVFYTIFKNGTVPSTFRKMYIFPIFKKGDPKETPNYGGISFMNTTTKLFTGLLLGRLMGWLEQEYILKKFQAGFRKGCGTIDQLFNFWNIAELVTSIQNKKLH